MDLLCVAAVCFLSIVTLTLMDLWFFMRQGLHYLYALLWLKPPKDIFEPLVFKSLVLTTDLDCLLHMNNARYLRETNIARCILFTGYRLSAKLKALGGTTILCASCSRHRRPLRLFERFEIHTRILGWDDHAFYLEQQFVTQHNDFVVAVVLCQQHVTGTTPAALVASVTQKKVESPELPEEVKHWLKYNEASSQRLRAESNMQKNSKDQ